MAITFWQMLQLAIPRTTSTSSLSSAADESLIVRSFLELHGP
jgi:hypothetical protein